MELKYWIKTLISYHYHYYFGFCLTDLVHPIHST